MMSRSKQQANNVESDSDWDSLPGDIPEPQSSPEPTNSPLPRGPAYSPVPTPPKQPYTKHHTSTKPTNMYKSSTSNPVKSSSSATTFEDRTGGMWNEDERNEEIKISVSKENNNNFKKNDFRKEKPDITSQTRKLESVPEKTKKPPFTDFREALSSPIPTAPNMREHHEMAGVNKAYRIETGDQIRTNHDSWDDRENESQTQPSKNAQLRMTTEVTERAIPTDRNWETRPSQMMVDKTRVVEMPYQDAPLSLNHTSGNCCMIQISDAAFDDRYRPSFFHGSKNHFHIKEEEPRASITDIADKSEVIVQRFWREVFGVLQIVINFFITFLLELFKTIILSVRYLLTGILYTTGDHFIKPVLSAIFNNFVQPAFVFVLNVLTILGELLRPILALTREILGQVSIPLRAFRLFVWESRGRKYNPV